MATATWAQESLVVCRMKVRGSRLDPLLCRQRVSRLLDEADITLDGFPRSAIVCLRRVRTTVDDGLFSTSSKQGGRDGWKRQIRTSLDQVARRAYRAAQDVVPATAEAVWFADWPELLACLGRDWSTHRLSTVWWWHSLFPRANFSLLTVAQWKDKPQWIPAVLHRLAATRELMPVIRRLSENDCKTLCSALIMTFGLTHLRTALQALPDAVRSEAASRVLRPEAALSITDRQAPGHDQTRDHESWFASVPEAADETMPVEARAFLIIGVLLHRTPQTVRSVSFSRSFQQWCETAPRPAAPMESSSAPTHREMPHQLGHESSRQAISSVHTPADRPPIQWQFSQLPSEERPAVRQPAPIAGVEQRSKSLEAEPSALGDKPRASDKLVNDRGAEAPLVIESAWGGLLYLINVALHLELYADFSHPLRPGLDLPIWRFLALIGEELAGETLRQDPLWNGLTDLCGPTDQPSHDWMPPDEWAMPAGWLDKFPSAEHWRWSSCRGRLRLVHPAGFVVCERIVQESGLEEELQRLKTDYIGMSNLERYDEDSDSADAVGLRRWLNWLVPYLRARLSLALAVDENDVRSLLLRRRCRIELTDGRFDSFFSLQDHPFEIRLAGLDRNPGWIPAAGRFVAFYFD
jgi:hypothetical protein